MFVTYNGLVSTDKAGVALVSAAGGGGGSVDNPLYVSIVITGLLSNSSAMFSHTI